MLLWRCCSYCLVTKTLKVELAIKRIIKLRWLWEIERIAFQSIKEMIVDALKLKQEKNISHHFFLA